MNAPLWVPNPRMVEASHYLRSVYVRDVVARDWKAVLDSLSVLYDIEPYDEPPRDWRKLQRKLGDDVRYALNCERMAL